MYDLVFRNRTSVFFQRLLDAVCTFKIIRTRHLPLENKPVSAAPVYRKRPESVDLFPGKGPTRFLSDKTADPILIHADFLGKRVKNEEKGKDEFQNMHIGKPLSWNPWCQKEHQCNQNQT